MDNDIKTKIVKLIKQRQESDAPPASLRHLSQKYRVPQYEIERVFGNSDSYIINPGRWVDGVWAEHRKQGERTLELRS